MSSSVVKVEGFFFARAKIILCYCTKPPKKTEKAFPHRQQFKIILVKYRFCLSLLRIKNWMISSASFRAVQCNWIINGHSLPISSCSLLLSHLLVMNRSQIPTDSFLLYLPKEVVSVEFIGLIDLD